MSAFHHYLCTVVKHQFGPLVQQLVSTLLTHGPLTLAAAVHYSALTPSQTRKALIIGIQHNVIVADYENKQSSAAAAQQQPASSASSPSAAAERKDGNAIGGGSNAAAEAEVRVLYRVHEAALKCRPRFPSYITMTRDRHGDDAALIVQSLCMHGILTTAQLLDHAIALQRQVLHTAEMAQADASPQSLSAASSAFASSSSQPHRPASASELPAVPDSRRQELEAALETLATAKWIRRALMEKVRLSEERGGGGDAGAAGEDEGEQEYLSTAETKKRKREEEKREKERDRQSREQQQEERKDADSGKEEKKGRGGRQPRGKKKEAAPAVERESRLHQLLTVEEQLQVAQQQDEAERSRSRREEIGGFGDHWTLNDATFTAETQRDALICYARDRISPTSAFVLSALLRIHPYDSVRPVLYDETTVMQAVADYSREVESPPALTSAALLSYLSEMAMDASGLLRSRPADSFSIEMAAFLSHLRLLQSQSILTASHSLLASRIFRLLASHTRMEESQIAEHCTASRQQTRETLHQLLRDGWLTLSEVPRSVDRAPSKTFFCWGVERSKEAAHVRQLMWSSAVKLQERLKEERERPAVQAVMDRLDRQGTITESERELMQRWQTAMDKLHIAQRQVQQTLAVWQD